MSHQTALEDAIQHVGSQAALAALIGVTQQAISRWIKLKKVPADYVVEIEKATKGKIKRHWLRPDLYSRAAP